MEGLELESPQGQGAYQLYMENSAAPLTGFLFALPLFLVYHAGLWWLNTFSGLRWANAVDISIANALNRLGMAGPLLSFIAVVVVFLTMHAMTGKPWGWPPLYTWFLMILESLALSLPVFLLSRLVVKLVDYFPPIVDSMLLPLLSGLPSPGGGAAAAAVSVAAFAGPGALWSAGMLSAGMLAAEQGAPAEIAWEANLVLSCGAGVYEEFFFRILVMGAFGLFLGKVLGVRGGWKWALAALFQALLFSASHHLPGSPEQITNVMEARAALPVLTFRTLAGLYFAAIYIERGFGIAAGSHACYDLLVVVLDMLLPLEVG